MFYPSGQQIRLTHNNIQAVITQVGATLRTLEIDGFPVIWGFDANSICSGGRGQVLSPWPNRLQDGRYSFADVDARVALDDPEHDCAIHGIVRWVPWEILETSSESVTLAYRLLPQPAYPFALQLMITYSLGDNGLNVRFEARNEGITQLPFGIGFHPYLAVRSGNVDSARLGLPANSRLLLNKRGLPIGVESVENTSYDFRYGEKAFGPNQLPLRNLTGMHLSDCFTDLDYENDDTWHVLFQPDDSGASLITLWGDKTFSHIMVFTGDTLESDIRRKAVAIEPMTCPPNALRTGKSLIVIDPGKTTTGSWGIEVTT